jgi:TolB-like protein
MHPTSGPRAKTVSIAVLPFADLSPGKDQEYFSDGLTEQLINNLARMPGVDVVARSSAFQFKGKSEDLRNVGRKLNVANILEGSVSREGSRVRITAELTKAADGFQLWSRSYDRQIGDIFAVQDEIARSVANELQLKLTGAYGAPLASPVATTTPDAYQAYLEGRYFSRRHEPGDYEKALAYTEKAIQLDPKYAPAWALRSYVVSSLAQQGTIDNAEGYRKARDYAEAAIALDSNFAEAYLSLALIQMEHGRDLGAGKSGRVSRARNHCAESGAFERCHRTGEEGNCTRSIARILDAGIDPLQRGTLQRGRGRFAKGIGAEPSHIHGTLLPRCGVAGSGAQRASARRDATGSAGAV